MKTAPGMLPWGSPPRMHARSFARGVQPILASEEVTCRPGRGGTLLTRDGPADAWLLAAKGSEQALLAAAQYGAETRVAATAVSLRERSRDRLMSSSISRSAATISVNVGLRQGAAGEVP